MGDNFHPQDNQMPTTMSVEEDAAMFPVNNNNSNDIIHNENTNELALVKDANSNANANANAATKTEDVDVNNINHAITDTGTGTVTAADMDMDIIQNEDVVTVPLEEQPQVSVSEVPVPDESVIDHVPMPMDVTEAHVDVEEAPVPQATPKAAPGTVPQAAPGTVAEAIQAAATATAHEVATPLQVVPAVETQTDPNVTETAAAPECDMPPLQTQTTPPPATPTHNTTTSVSVLPGIGTIIGTPVYSPAPTTTPKSTKQERMDNIWMGHFRELEQYLRENGHVRVPRKSGPLGEWVRTQRRYYKLWRRGESVPLTKGRMELLDTLGFVWLPAEEKVGGGFRGGRPRKRKREEEESPGYAHVHAMDAANVAAAAAAAAAGQKHLAYLQHVPHSLQNPHDVGAAAAAAATADQIGINAGEIPPMMDGTGTPMNMTMADYTTAMPNTHGHGHAAITTPVMTTKQFDITTQIQLLEDHQPLDRDFFMSPPKTTYKTETLTTAHAHYEDVTTIVKRANEEFRDAELAFDRAQKKYEDVRKLKDRADELLSRASEEVLKVEMDDSDDEWIAMYKCLVTYQEKHGNILFPRILGANEKDSSSTGASGAASVENENDDVNEEMEEGDEEGGTAGVTAGEGEDVAVTAGEGEDAAVTASEDAGTTTNASGDAGATTNASANTPSDEEIYGVVRVVVPTPATTILETVKSVPVNPTPTDGIATKIEEVTEGMEVDENLNETHVPLPVDDDDGGGDIGEATTQPTGQEETDATEADTDATMTDAVPVPDTQPTENAPDVDGGEVTNEALPTEDDTRPVVAETNENDVTTDAATIAAAALAAVDTTADTSTDTVPTANICNDATVQTKSINVTESLLHEWVGKMRKYPKKQLKKWRRYALDKLGFVWHQYNATWTDRYRELVEFREKHGHTIVPTSNSNLGVWVGTQRKQYRLMQQGKPSHMTTERMEMLNEIDFVWHVNTWNERFEELKVFKESHGNFLVPTEHQNKQLRPWITTQRSHYRFLQEGKPSQLTQERIELLEGIGFPWKTREDWQTRYSELVEFMEEAGNCSVPRGYTRFPKLYRWVNCQRMEYQKHIDGSTCRLKSDQIALLESIGFT